MRRKYTFISVLIILFFVCVFSVGCKPKDNDKDKEQPIYYYVTFDENNGNTSSMLRVKDGDKVNKPQETPIKDGYNFLYWTYDDKEFNFDTPITKHITLIAKYEENVPHTTRIIWNEDEAFRFEFDGNVPRTVNVGTTIKFQVKTSPYYEGNIEVLVNDKKVSENEDGFYTFVAEDVTTTNVEVNGLNKEDNTIKGKGTSDNPYRIANESQFKAFTDGVNSLTDTQYNEAYIVLDADLDFKGFSIDVVGTKLNENHFSGHFDGQNHTITNFKLNEEEGIYGLFGYAVVSEIANINIQNDIVYIPTSEQYNLIGGLVAYNIASDIMNCHYTGSIKVQNNLSPAAEVYVGGLVGYMQGYASTGSATLSYATVNGDIILEGSMETTSSGGLVGLLLGADNLDPAIVYNSCYFGTVGGKSLTTGGLTGTLRMYSSIANCFSKGVVKSVDTTRNTAAGGISGLAENETAITNSFSTSQILSVNPNETDYIKGTLVGSSFKDRANGMDDRMVLIVNSFYAPDGNVEVNSNTYDLEKYEDALSLLGWNNDDWNNNLTPNYEKGEQNEFEVSFDFGRNVTNEGLDGSALTQMVDKVKIKGYLPIYWLYNGSGMNTFVADDGTISYGFFLDEARTIRVPSSYLITQNTTIYVGFADYSEVVGEYYVLLNNKDIKLSFESMGKMVMTFDGIVANYMYVYDGTKIVIKKAYFAYIEYPSFADKYDLDVDYYAEVVGNNLVIYNNDFFPKDGLEIIAHKHNAAMGTWYSSDDKIYTFLSDGTGNIDQTSTFMYECTETSVTITVGKDVIKATISNNGTLMEASNGTILSINKFDDFKGVWEAEFMNPDEIRFDGKGSVTYKTVVYDYVIDENEVLTFADYSVSFNENGMLVLSHNGHQKVFGKKGSFIGTWTDTALDYWISFEGINKDGYGYGYDSYGYRFSYTETTEDDEQSFINLYYGTRMYGYGHLAIGKQGDEMLQLAIYTPSNGMIVDDYNVGYMDPFHGEWNGENGVSLSFNGLGAYDIYYFINTLNIWWDVRGYLTITENNEVNKVRYYFNRTTGKGSFEYKETAYQIEIIDDGITINGQIYRRPDALSEYEYQFNETRITFNGKSSVNHGRVIFTQDSKTQEYRYEIDGTMTKIYDNDKLVYTLTTNDVYVLLDVSNNQTYELGLYHNLMKNVYAISADSELIFDQSFDIYGTASATLKSKDDLMELQVKYIDKDYVALYYQDTFLYYVYYIDELSAVLCDYNFNPTGVIAKEDELRGTWESSDGMTIAFSGISHASKYGRASCKVMEKDEIENYIEYYFYEKQEDYFVIYSIENDSEVEKYYVYTTYQENAIAYQQGDKTIYVVVVTD